MASSARVMQNYLVIWLDGNIDENNHDCQNSLAKFREVSNTVYRFTDIDECIVHINEICEEKIFFISSGALGQIAVPRVHDLPQIDVIYIFCGNKQRHQQWTQQWSKIKGIFTDVAPICQALKKAAYECDQNNISFSVIDNSSDSADQSFMYTQILKEILLTIDFQENDFEIFINYCREQFKNNESKLKQVDKLKKEYRLHKPIWWYTCECFLYSMVNRALRMMEVDLIIKLGFFLRDLHEDITRLHSKQYPRDVRSDVFVVYRGQDLSQTDFDKIKTTGGLLSMNSFFSTSRKRQVSLNFSYNALDHSGCVAVLYVINVDPSIQSSPFAYVDHISDHTGEQEILFSMHSVFRIGQIRRTVEQNRIWEVELTLTGDQDPQFHKLTKQIRKETFPDETGWYRLGLLLINLGHFDRAEQVYNSLLDQTTKELEQANIYHHIGRIKNKQGKYKEAITFYEKSLAIDERTLPSNHPDLAASYDNIGRVYNGMGDYSQALSFHQKANAIHEKTLSSDHPHLAASYTNTGRAYDTMGDYSQALSFHQKALKIYEKALSSKHPHLATSCGNMGAMYHGLGDYLQALSFHQRALEIRKEVLPSNHPDLGVSYSSVGRVYDDMGQYSEALSFHQRASAIYEKTLSSTHPRLAASYNNIGRVYNNMEKYSQALSFHQRALAIHEGTLLSNHPDLAASYSNIGRAYDAMADYSQALSFHQKALAIYESTLPANHPYLAISYDNIGKVYYHKTDYDKALRLYERSLQIGEKSLSSNHPKLAWYYNDIGMVYGKKGDYPKALSFYKRALQIAQQKLSATHPHLRLYRHNVETVDN